MVYRSFHVCSTWMNFHHSLVKAKTILENNQYPSSFYERIIEKMINKIRETKTVDAEEENDETEKKLIFVQYRGKIKENFEQSLNKIITTFKKTRSLLPSLKPPVYNALKSGLVYKITCSRCQLCSVGQTT